ncbi:hypothetical protein EKPJFOCH_1369 [Methylobacterium thuringiense]|uniref:Uncharacterized protein n=1 Tax=Methylobacterium thuringiense TaxID=1003091 RepID=A0ABQ4THM6_9HYPH|nr:hypothetical protein EKPJFOCH_1369 [Methylobacterium thuringiense]
MVWGSSGRARVTGGPVARSGRGLRGSRRSPGSADRPGRPMRPCRRPRRHRRLCTAPIAAAAQGGRGPDAGRTGTGSSRWAAPWASRPSLAPGRPGPAVTTAVEPSRGVVEDEDGGRVPCRGVEEEPAHRDVGRERARLPPREAVDGDGDCRGGVAAESLRPAAMVQQGGAGEGDPHPCQRGRAETPRICATPRCQRRDACLPPSATGRVHPMPPASVKASPARSRGWSMPGCLGFSAASVRHAGRRDGRAGSIGTVSWPRSRRPRRRGRSW